MTREKKHDFDWVGISIGAARMVLVGFAGFISWWLSTYFEPMQQTMQNLSISAAGINQQLANIDKITTRLEQKQNEILEVVHANSSNVKRNYDSVKKLEKNQEVVLKDVNDLKIKVYYLENK